MYTKYTCKKLWQPHFVDASTNPSSVFTFSIQYIIIHSSLNLWGTAEICDEPTLNQLTCGTMNAPGNLALGLGSSSGSSSSDGVTTRVTPVTTATTLPTNSDKLEEQNAVEKKKRREKKKILGSQNH